MNTKLTLLCMAMFALAIPCAYAEEIPSWVKHNADWWSKGQISDGEFVKGVQYMVDNGILKVPTSDKNVVKSSSVPSWVKQNAGWWSSGALGDSEFLSGIQYLVGAGIIQVNQPVPIQKVSENSEQQNETMNTSKCDSLTTAADKETCIDDIQKTAKMQDQIKIATPYVVGPVTFYLVGTDGIATGDGGIIITAHTIIENTGSQSSNVDLFCTGPLACNYHLTDGQNQYPPQIFSLTSGHLEIIYHKPVAIDWAFYSNNNLAKFSYEPSKQYSLKIDEPFGNGLIPLKIKAQ